jgi:hypothetical protein
VELGEGLEQIEKRFWRNNYELQRISQGETVYINLNDHMEDEEVAKAEDTGKMKFCQH